MEEYLDQLRQLGFARIADKIMLVWGTPEVKGYFKDLLITDRHDRQGFPKEVYGVLMKLYIMSEDHQPTEIVPDIYWLQGRRNER
jgi:hypothetical protein